MTSDRPISPAADGVERAVVMVGTFDGVHIGHAALVAKASALADAHSRTGTPTRIVALAFDPNPITLLAPDRAPPRLSSFAQRRRWLIELGCDEALRLVPTPALLGLAPDDFIQRVVADHHAVAFVEGPDFRFGKGRAGDVESLARLGSRLGFETHVVDPAECVLTDHTIVRASSTMARWLLRHGRVADARRVLGRHYELDALVVPGDRRGRTIGFPTANIVPVADAPDFLAPHDGVYACLAILPDDRVVPAAVNVGKRPTFNGMQRSVEAHLLLDDAPTPSALKEPAQHASPWRPVSGLPEYNWPIRLRFVAWLRDQVRFDSVDRLREQLVRDVARVRPALEAELAVDRVTDNTNPFARELAQHP
jgi:riboflavin kinase/FMN adenylyltransferase